jgi:8-oxo-dGTP pyrophosphatase MutT (NUDIX family)
LNLGKLPISAGVVIHDGFGRLLLQKREQKKTIYFPGLWGVFGGACNDGEHPKDAARREIIEELAIDKQHNFRYLFHLSIQSPDLGEVRERHFYCTQFSKDDLDNIQLYEGETFQLFSPNRLPKPIDFVPFDLAAILMFTYSKLECRQIRPQLT